MCDRVITNPPTTTARHELLLIFSLHIVDQKFSRIFLNLLGIAFYKDNADDCSNNQQDQSPYQPIAKGGAGKTGGEACGEEVDSGFQITDPNSQQDKDCVYTVIFLEMLDCQVCKGGEILD